MIMNISLLQIKNIKKLIATISIFITYSQIICAAEIKPIPPFTSICSDKKATGFNWVNGDWVAANFRPSRYMIEKIPDQLLKNKSLASISCGPIPPAATGDFGFQWLYSCYRLTENLEARPFSSYAICKETYQDGKLVGINCPDPIRTQFTPDGPYIKIPSAVSSTPNNHPEKDSLVISVGNCKKIK